MITQTISTVALLALAAAGGCDDTSKTDTGNGRFLFTDTGVIQFDKTIRAHDMPGRGAACRWRVETEPKRGLASGQSPRIVEHGDGGNAKLKVEKPDTVKVYLVTKGCGRWS